MGESLCQLPGTFYYIQSNTLKLADMRTIKLLTILHTIMQTKFPKYFSDTFEFNSGRSPANTRSGLSVFRIPHHRTTTYNKSFTVTACTFMELPSCIPNVYPEPSSVCRCSEKKFLSFCYKSSC